MHEPYDKEIYDKLKKEIYDSNSPYATYFVSLYKILGIGYFDSFFKIVLENKDDNIGKYLELCTKMYISFKYANDMSMKRFSPTKIKNGMIKKYKNSDMEYDDIYRNILKITNKHTFGKIINDNKISLDECKSLAKKNIEDSIVRKKFSWNNLSSSRNILELIEVLIHTNKKLMEYLINYKSDVPTNVEVEHINARKQVEKTGRINKLGNLTLLSKKDNVYMSNDHFIQKVNGKKHKKTKPEDIPTYFTSGFKVTNYIVTPINNRKVNPFSNLTNKYEPDYLHDSNSDYTKGQEVDFSECDVKRRTKLLAAMFSEFLVEY